MQLTVMGGPSQSAADAAPSIEPHVEFVEEQDRPSKHPRVECLEDRTPVSKCPRVEVEEVEDVDRPGRRYVEKFPDPVAEVLDQGETLFESIRREQDRTGAE